MRMRSLAEYDIGDDHIGAAIGLSFEGVGMNDFALHNCHTLLGFHVAPPDTEAAVGDTQVVQWVNFVLCRV